MPPPALADFAVDQLVDADDVVDASAAVASAPVAPRAQTTSSARLDKRTLTTSLLVIGVIQTTNPTWQRSHFRHHHARVVTCSQASRKGRWSWALGSSTWS